MASAISFDILPFAEEEIVAQTDYYLRVSGEELALRWQASVDATILSLGRLPERAAFLPFQGPLRRRLRRIVVQGFPNHMVIYEYLAEQRTITIVSVRHGATDIERWVQQREI